MTIDRGHVLSSRFDASRDDNRRRGCVEPVTAYPTFVGKVYGNPTVPTSVGVYYSVNPVDVTGTEREGGAAVFTTDSTRTVLVDVIGPKPAVAGDYLVCRFVGNRWVAERVVKSSSTPIGVVVPGCPCSPSPATIHMTSSSPGSNNGMLQSAVIQYAPTPSNLLPVVLTQSSYLSTTSFIDNSLKSSFYYLITCYFGSYLLTRVFPASPLGSPYRDSTRYTWYLGTPGNSCTPFLMAKGVIFSGGDASCVVTLSQ